MGGPKKGDETRPGFFLFGSSKHQTFFFLELVLRLARSFEDRRKNERKGGQTYE
jgi:hypothetical protein